MFLFTEFRDARMPKNAQRGAAEIEHVKVLNNRWSVSWDDLRIFLVCADSPSFRSAARTLSISSSTVTRRIERLETALGVRLANRFPEGMTLTTEGKLIADGARSMERALCDVERKRNLLEVTEQGEVTIAVTEGLGCYWLMPKLIEFQREHPYIQINLLCAMESVDVLRLEADVAVQFDQPTAQDVIVCKLGRIHVHSFAARSYLEVYGTPTSKFDLKNHRLVQQVAPQLDDRALAYYFDLENFDPSVSARTNSSTAHLYAIEKGAGIGLLPTYATALGAPVVPLDIGGRYYRDILMTYHKDVKSSQHCALVINWIKEIFDARIYPWFSDEFIHPDEFCRNLPEQAEVNRGHGFAASIPDELVASEPPDAPVSAAPNVEEKAATKKLAP